MKATSFRVTNFRNVDDSDWVSLEKVTAFVGRNESGKTSLLKALHKFNPATPEPYDAQREFPRDRYTRDYVAGQSSGAQWPVCSVTFVISDEVRARISELLEEDATCPETAILTRHYDGRLSFEYTPEVCDKPLAPDSVLAALKTFASGARRLPALDQTEEEDVAKKRTRLAKWASGWREDLKSRTDLRGDSGTELLTKLNESLEELSDPDTADMVEQVQSAIEPILDMAGDDTLSNRINAIVERSIPVFIYFENYGVLDSAVWLSRFLEDRGRDPNDSRVRTVSAMFKHVGLDPNTIEELGEEEAEKIAEQGKEPPPEVIAEDERRKEQRAIQLNSASLDISRKFSDWWSQRRHKIRYHADGDYFRIWISDDRRPDVEIELEARSKGFQWFFSFYLVFLVESDEGHKEAFLLLDEPGLHLHATAQQELISFFERLSETNQLSYTTHSPFLIDGEHLHRVRPVTEDETGHSRVTAESWPKDRETIFPLQAAAGYAMIRGLFRHQRNLLVEGMSDFYYLQALSQQCSISKRTCLPDHIYIVACGGTKHVGHFASLFLGHKVRPLVLLDGDDAGRVRQDALMKELYKEHDSGVLMLDEALGRAGQEVEIEDLIGEPYILGALRQVAGVELSVSGKSSRSKSLPDRIMAAATRDKVVLPDGWKMSVAVYIVSSWAEQAVVLDDAILDSAGLLFTAINARFAESGA